MLHTFNSTEHAKHSQDAFILRLFRERNVRLDGKVTLSRAENNDQPNLARAYMLEQVNSADQMRYWYPEVFDKRRIGEITFFGPTNRFDQNGHPSSIVIKWEWNV